MKKIIIHFLSVMMLATIITSCSKSSNNNGGLANGYLKARVDGTLKNADLAVTATYTSGVLAMSGRWTSGGGIDLIIPSYTSGATGTFNISSGNFNTAQVYLSATPTDVFSANAVTGSGSITISSMSSSKVKGSFQFTGRNSAAATKSVTEGEFEINF
jgi:hypothetical protein